MIWQESPFNPCTYREGTLKVVCHLLHDTLWEINCRVFVTSCCSLLTPPCLLLPGFHIPRPDCGHAHVVLLPRVVFSCRPLRRGRARKCWSPVESLGLGEAPSLLGVGPPYLPLPMVGAMIQLGAQGLGSCLPSPPPAGCAHRSWSSWARAHVCFAKSKGFVCEGCGCLRHLRLTHTCPGPGPRLPHAGLRAVCGKA